MKRGTPRSTRTETLFPDTTLIVSPGQDAVRIADFSAFEGDALPAGVRVFGPDVAAPDQGDAPLESNRVSRNLDRTSTRLTSSHQCASRMPSSACKNPCN